MVSKKHILPPSIPDGTADDEAVNKGQLDGAIEGLYAINNQTGTSYTLALSDLGKVVEMDNASANTLTVPPNSSVAFPVGSRVDVVQMGAGQTTLTEGAGVTINSLDDAPKIQGQYGGATLYKHATDEWVAIGALEV